jgi:hypothetical protein|tara:strand:- start:1939 stop:2277 length:339 start_codon:yes stop_codon:yes gene_type:complete
MTKLQSAILDRRAVEDEAEIVERISAVHASEDKVNSPSHYASGDEYIECIDAMMAAFGAESVRVFCEISAFKYLWRMNRKGASSEDKKKAIWYLKFALSTGTDGDADPRRGS